MFRKAADFLTDRLPVQPEVAVVLGSGQHGLSSLLLQPTEIPYTEIPEWPVPTTPGHAGMLTVGLLGGRRVAVLSGRVHLYEGYSAAEVVFGVRALGRLGVRTLVMTNAAGAINTAFRPGQLVLIADHINLLGANPLAGPNDQRLGPRFPGMGEAYAMRLREIAAASARELGIDLPEGVYAAVPGPSYETPAEVRFLRTAGADLVGMSTVLEVIAARHMGIGVLGISCVTNLAAGLSSVELSHEEVLATGRAASTTLGRLVAAFLARL